MEVREEQVIASLLDKDPELKKYYEEHQELEKKLAEFESWRFSAGIAKAVPFNRS